jgi:hypothetical protein
MFGRKSEKVEFQGKSIYEIDDYLEIEEQLAEKYEFEDGIVIRKYNSDDWLLDTIVLNLDRLISKRLPENNFRVYSKFFAKGKGQRVFIKDKNSIFYPDLFITEKNEEFYINREDIVCNPVVIIEISSYESMKPGSDQKLLEVRSRKLWNYQCLESLKEYVLITDLGGEYVVEQYLRLNEKGCWKYKTSFGREKGKINFESVEVILPIAEILSL